MSGREGAMTEDQPEITPPTSTQVGSAQPESLPRLIEQAAVALASAKTAAEILEAGDRAKVAYTAAKMAARLAKAKEAHDTVAAVCRKAMGDALVIEAQAQCRLADEYDAAQERGEVQKAGGDRKSKIIIPNENNDPTVTDIGLTSKLVHEARIIRDAEKANPGIVRKTVDEKLSAGQMPTLTDVKRATKPNPIDVYDIPLPLRCPCPLCTEVHSDEEIIEAWRRFREMQARLS
jgi:hypothetical protein